VSQQPPPQASAEQLRAVVDGRVQGVGYRIFVYEQARALRLTGWVRNLRSGSVEVLAEGAPLDLAALVERLKQGPRGALVTHVSLEWASATGGYTTFEIEPTAP
jgi:acylphosphatase